MRLCLAPFPQGVTYRLTQGVAKNIIPAIASTNAFVAAVCALEVFKLATLCCAGLDNYLMCAEGDARPATGGSRVSPIFESPPPMSACRALADCHSLVAGSCRTCRFEDVSRLWW